MKKAIVLLVFVVAGPRLWAQVSPAGPAPAENTRAQIYYYFSMAQLLEQQGQLPEAINQYKKALDLDPKNSVLYSEMADMYRRSNLRNGIADAVKNAEKAIELDADNLAAHKLLFDVYRNIISPPPRGSARATPEELQNAVEKGIHECEEIVRIDPSATDYYMYLGFLYQSTGKPDKAVAIYRKLLGVEPGSEEGAMSLAKLHLDAGNVKEAIALLEKFVRDRPDSDSAWQALAEAYSADREFDKAVDAYKRAVQLNPSDADLLQEYAQALYVADKLDDAVKAFQQLLDDNPNDDALLLRLGQIYRRQTKYGLARTTLQKAEKIAPSNLEIPFNLALVDRDDGLIEDALKRLTNTVKMTEHPNGRYSEAEQQSRGVFMTYIAILNSTLGRYEEAIRWFTELRAISPQKPKVDSYIVDTYRTARNLDKAVAYAQKALMEAPDSRELQITYADVIGEKGRVDEGIKALEKLIKNTDEDMEIFATMTGIYERARKFNDAQNVLDNAAKRFPRELQVHFLQGALYEKQKKFNEAEKAFLQALELDKENPQVLNYLGYMLADKGTKLDEALAFIQKAVDQDPTNGAYLDSLGWAYFRLNRLELAEQYLKKAVIFVGTDSDIHDHLGDLYNKMARYEEALTAWTKSLELTTDSEDADKVRKKISDVKNKIAKR